MRVRKMQQLVYPSYSNTMKQNTVRRIFRHCDLDNTRKSQKQETQIVHIEGVPDKSCRFLAQMRAANLRRLAPIKQQ